MESAPHPPSHVALPAPAAPRTLGLSWPLLVVLATFFGLLAQLPVNKILGDGDAYWHIAAGWAGLVALTATSLALTLTLLTRFLMRRMEPVHALLLVALSALAALLTPFGVEAVEFTLHVMSLKVALAAIGEWQSPNFHLLQPFLAWLLLVGLVYLALKHQRNIALLGLVSPLLLAVPLARGLQVATSGAADAAALDRWFRALAQPSRWGARVAGLCVVALLVAVVLPAREPRPEASITPQRAVEAALAAGAQGPVFNDYGFGDYLIYRGIPVHIDGRADMYGNSFLQETIDAMQLKDRHGFLAFLERHGFGWSLLLPGTPAVALLDGLPGWRRVYADDGAVVHVRDGARRP